MNKFMGLGADDRLLLERIENDFAYYPPAGDKADRHQKMRKLAKELAREVVQLCPAGRERMTALTKLEEVLMWANAAIARPEANE